MHKIALALLATAALSVPAFAQAPNNTAPASSTTQQSAPTQKPNTMAQGTPAKQPAKMAQHQNKMQANRPKTQAAAEKALSQKHYYNKATSQRMISTRDLSRSEVRSIQTALDKNGFDVGAVDGRWGPRTAGALRHFEHKKRLKVGELSGKTISELGLSDAPFTKQMNRANAPAPASNR